MRYSQKSMHFFELVYEVCREIPKGRVTTYGTIAEYLGAKKGARMVGWAMNNAHQKIPLVPAHRVVNRTGHLTGKNHFAHPLEMETLLKKEGVLVKKNQIIDFKTFFWDPNIELSAEI